MKDVLRIKRMKSINDDFDKLLSNLEPTIFQRTAIIKHRETIDQALINSPALTLYNPSRPSFLTGSYKRNTLIRPINDVDLYVVVHYGLHAKHQKPIQVLRLIQRILTRGRLSRTNSKNDSPCVVVKFADHYFEVVPVYSISDDSDMYAVPNGKGTDWEPCYPNIPQKWLSESNHKNNAKFVPIIKLLKQWNREKSVGLKSFHLELITGLVFDRVTEIKNYPQAIYDWMYYVCRWLHENSSPFIFEPGMTDVFVDGYLFAVDRKLRVTRNKLRRSLEEAQNAYYNYLNGRIGPAKSIYSRMFGSKYPTPPQPKLETKPPTLPSISPPEPINPIEAIVNARLQNANYQPALGLGNKDNGIVNALLEARMAAEKDGNLLYRRNALLKALDTPTANENKGAGILNALTSGLANYKK